MTAFKDQGPTILVTVQQDFILRDLLDSGTLDCLKKRFHLRFVISGNVDESVLSQFGTVLARHRINRVRLWLWNSLGALKSILHWQPIVGEMGQRYYNRKKDGNYRGTLRLLRIVHRVGLGKIVAKLLHAAMIQTVKYSLPFRAQGIDLVLVPSIMRDVVADDAIFWAKLNGIPALALQVNLDTFNIKVSAARPDFWGLWGDQSWYMARLVQNFQPECLFIVGSPRFDAYRKIKISRTEARQALGLPEDATVILFLGGSAVFDETRALKQIEQAILSGWLPANTVVVYKPHPKGPGKGATEPFVAEEFCQVVLYKSVHQQRWLPLEEYPALFAAGDAVITPFSTIGFEAACYGLPMIGVGYHSRRPQFWNEAVTIHTKAFFDKQWCSACTEEDQFLKALKHLPEMIGNRLIAEQARNDVRAVVYENEKAYGERVTEIVETILKIKSNQCVIAAER